MLEAEPLTWRIRANVVAAGLGERVRGSGPPYLRVLWAWSFFVIGGMAFQKTSEHWQVVVPDADRSIPTAAFDIVQVAAAIGSIAVLAAVALALPAFLAICEVAAGPSCADRSSPQRQEPSSRPLPSSRSRSTTTSAPDRHASSRPSSRCSHGHTPPPPPDGLR